MEMKLSPVKYVSPDKLNPNPLNEKFFRPDTGGEIDQLFNDIKERGILVSLIAKSDGILLAGHRRLSIAKEIGLKYVPVQYLLQELTLEEEKSFIVKDNALRRHLSPEERRALYRFIVPGFEDKVKVKSSKTMGLNVADVASKAGLDPKTVGYDLTRIRRAHERSRLESSEIDPINEKEIDIFKRAMARILNVATLGSLSTNKECVKILDNVKSKVETIIFNLESKKPVSKIK